MNPVMEPKTWQNEELETIIVGLLIGLESTAWDALKQQLLDFTPHLLTAAAIRHAQQIYETSAQVAWLKTLTKAELQRLNQQIKAPDKLCTYLVTAPKEELDLIVTQSISMCPTQCSPDTIKRHITAQWPELTKPEYQIVLYRFAQIIHEPATQRKIALHNAKHPQDTATLQAIIVGTILAIQDTSWESLLAKLSSLIKPEALALAYQIYTSDRQVAELKAKSKHQLAQLAEETHTARTTYARLAKASQTELECIVAINITMCANQCSPLLVQQRITAKWPDLETPPYRHVLDKMIEIINTPACLEKIQLQKAKINTR